MSELQRQITGRTSELFFLPLRERFTGAKRKNRTECENEMKIFSIDPGNIYSAYCVIDGDTLKPLEFAKITNIELYNLIREHKFEEADRSVIEMVESYGMPVGREVFDTVFWIGRYYESLKRKCVYTPALLYRKEEKLHICHDSRAKDTNIRQALINRFAQHDLKNGKGTKNDPDWFYGFKADVWASYAVGITFAETKI